LPGPAVSTFPAGFKGVDADGYPIDYVTGSVVVERGLTSGASYTTAGPKPWIDTSHPNFKGGTKLDGTTNDQPAYQAAIDYAGSIFTLGAARGAIVLQGPGIALILLGLIINQNGVVLQGSGVYASAIQIPTSGFVGAYILNVSGASNVTVRDLNLQGQSATYSLNPAADAILLNNGCDGTRLQNITFFYINSWCFNILPGTGNTFATFIRDVHLRLVKQGLHITGQAANFYSVGLHVVNFLGDSVLNGDCAFMDDATDCTWSASQMQTNTGGSTIHIKGLSTAIYLAGCDCGGNSTNAFPSFLVENNGANVPKYIKYVGGTLSLGTPGISWVSGTEGLFVGVDISFNVGGGAIVAAGNCGFSACNFTTNNTSLAATTYDLSVTGGTVDVDGCRCSGANVTTAINPASVGLRLRNCRGVTGWNQIYMAGAAPGANALIAVEGASAAIGIVIQAHGAASIFMSSDSVADFWQWSPQVGVLEEFASGGSAAIDLRKTPKGAGVVDFNYAAIALGGGAAPTLGTIGGTGPAAAAQNSWLKIKMAGVASYIPVWR
jgi:hypothetical protein